MRITIQPTNGCQSIKNKRRGSDLNRDTLSGQAFQACAIPDYATTAYGPAENWTPDSSLRTRRFTTRLLAQNTMDQQGFEPWTSPMPWVRSTELIYWPNSTF